MRQLDRFSAMKWGVISFGISGLPPMYLFQSLKEAKAFAKSQIETFNDVRSENYVHNVRVYRLTTTPSGEQIGESVVNRKIRYAED